MNSQNYCSISTPNAIYYMWLQENWNIVPSVSGSAEHMYVILWKHKNERLIQFGSKVKLWSMKWFIANQHQQLVKYEAMLWIFTPMADPTWLVKEQPPLLWQGYKDTELKSDMLRTFVLSNHLYCYLMCMSRCLPIIILCTVLKKFITSRLSARFMPQLH